MAKSFFEKFSVLVQSSVSDFAREVGARLPDLPAQASQDLGREVEALRLQVNKALKYEDKLEADLQALRREVEELDRAADAAVDAGNDALARRVVQKMRRLQRRAAILESDLEQHQRATAELISNVNYFDAMVGDLSRQQAQAHQTQQAEAVEAPPLPTPPSRPLSSAEQRLAGDEAPTPAPPPPPVEKGEIDTEPRTVRIRVVAGDLPAAPPPVAESTEAAPQKPKRYRVISAAPDEAEAEPEIEAEAKPEKPVLPEVERLTRALRKARKSMEEAEQKMSDASAVRSSIEAAAGAPLPEITGVPEPDPDDIDRDLAERRTRLNKPDDTGEGEVSSD